MRQNRRVYLKSSQIEIIAELLGKTRIFSGADKEMLIQAVEAGELKSYERNETIFCEKEYTRALVLIVSGSASVTKGKIAMSKLSKGELFGAVTLYSDYNYYVTKVTANAKSKVLFLSKETISDMMAKNIEIAENFIEYLSERIYFLNSRIDAFTAGSAADKLREYLINNAVCVDGEKVFSPNSIMEIAKKLDLARASLYRAIDELCKNGEIEKCGKKFIIKTVDK